MEGSMSILLIEDNKHDQYFFSQAVNKIANVTLYDIAKNGRDALDKLSESDSLPDMIFSDINMPVMDGIECLSQIIKTPRIKDIPVIILSSVISKTELLCEMGAKVFIEKPNNCILLQKLIEHVIKMDFEGIGCMDQTIQTKPYNHLM